MEASSSTRRGSNGSASNEGGATSTVGARTGDSGVCATLGWLGGGGTGASSVKSSSPGCGGEYVAASFVDDDDDCFSPPSLGAPSAGMSSGFGTSLLLAVATVAVFDASSGASAPPPRACDDTAAAFTPYGTAWSPASLSRGGASRGCERLTDGDSATAEAEADGTIGEAADIPSRAEPR